MAYSMIRIDIEGNRFLASEKLLFRLKNVRQITIIVCIQENYRAFELWIFWFSYASTLRV